MSVTVVVQARTGSTRLPGKVLMDVGGRPMLRLLLDRLAGVHDRFEATVVVATSTEPADDAVAAVALDAGVHVVRGDEHDVLGRFTTVLDRHPARTVVRITADCPLTDPELVAEALALHRRTGADYTSNTLIRTHPDGLDVEVVSADALLVAHRETTDPFEREHVTPFVYRRSSRFRLAALRSSDRLGHLRWTVDTAADLESVRRMVARAGSPSASWRDLLGSLPAPERRLMRDGIEPAVAGEVPERFTAFDDPARLPLVVVRRGAAVGWLVLDVVDGHATVDGLLPPDQVPSARRELAALVAAAPQITSGDLSLDHLTLTGAAS